MYIPAETWKLIKGKSKEQSDEQTHQQAWVTGLPIGMVQPDTMQLGLNSILLPKVHKTMFSVLKKAAENGKIHLVIVIFLV